MLLLTIISVMLTILYRMLVCVPLPMLLTIAGTLTICAYLYARECLCTGTGLPVLCYKDSSLTSYIKKKCKRLATGYSPPLWSINGHIQTILGFIVHMRFDFEFQREYLQMKDKGIVALDWGHCEASKIRRTSAIVIVIPGLAGGASAVKFLCMRAVERGYRTVVFNRRGHGGCPLTTPKLQCFSDPSDFRQVVKYIRGRFPAARLTSVGVSTGTSLLMSYLGEYGSSSYLRAAVCISPGYDWERLFCKRLPQPYESILLCSMKRIVCLHGQALSSAVDIERVVRSRSMNELEKELHCRKLGGFPSMVDYWEKNNCMKDIDDISIPVLCINSMDDPVCTTENIPYDLFQECPNFLLVQTRRGGHCGFLGGTNFESWADKLSVDYLTIVLYFLDKHNTKG